MRLVVVEYALKMTELTSMRFFLKPDVATIDCKFHVPMLLGFHNSHKKKKMKCVAVRHGST